MDDVRRALERGTWAVAGIMLLVLYRPAALDGPVEPRAVVVAGYLASVGLWALAGILLTRRPHPVLCRVLLGAVLLTTAVGTLVVPAGLQHTSTSWAAATNGWVLLAVALAGRRGPAVAWPFVPPACAVAVAATAGVGELVLTSGRAIGILGPQFLVAVAAGTLERTTREAVALHLHAEAVAAARQAAQDVHRDRLHRSATVWDVVRPVLTELAALVEGTAPSAAVRRRAGVAAARVRRLMAQWHDERPDPLGTELGACLDRLQSDGLRLDLVVPAGPEVVVPPELGRAAASVLPEVARHAGTRLRVTVLATADDVRLSAVCDLSPAVPRTVPPGTAQAVPRTAAGTVAPVLPDVPAPTRVASVTADSMLWVEITCPLDPVPPTRPPSSSSTTTRWWSPG